MRYEQFLVAWRHAFDHSRMFAELGAPTETLDLRTMTRAYETRLQGPARVEPYTISATLGWRWDALQTARTQTTEEDFLRTIIGEGLDLDVETERPWFRVDVQLVAYAHLDARLQLPGSESWKRWVLEIGAQMDNHLSNEMDDDGAIWGWRGEPSAELRCGPGGQLFLTGVEIRAGVRAGEARRAPPVEGACAPAMIDSAWRAIELPRIWDDPERRRDPEPGPQLADLARRVRGAIDVWTEALRTLATAAQVH